MSDALVPAPHPEPVEGQLDQAEIKALLLELDGDVTQTAKQLGVDPQRLRAYVRAVPALRAAVEETLEQGADAAIAILYEGLRDRGSFQNRYYAAKEFLRSEAGRKRGFGPREPAGAALEVKSGTNAGASIITIRWLEPPKEET
jgi:hypothetical protein